MVELPPRNPETPAKLLFILFESIHASFSQPSIGFFLLPNLSRARVTVITVPHLP
jgi:hypothetical protein